MAFAKIDENSRIVNWSEDHLDDFDTEFQNGDYVDEKCVNGVNDFVIRDGVAYFEPTKESVKEALMRKLSETETNDVQAAICELAEQQIAYESDVNAALCELYDLISGFEKDG